MKRYRAIILVVFAVFWVAFPAYADNLGDSADFSVSAVYDFYDRRNISATLRLISDKSYFYIEDEYWNGLNSQERKEFDSSLKEFANEFDNRIYPTLTGFFGSEPNPGIDGDGRITIVVTQLKNNIGGYFNTDNEYSTSVNPRSNERELININAYQVQNTRRIDAFVGHEFQHLISFNQKELKRGVSDDVWLNELRSEYAITLLGYNDDFRGSTLERRAIALVRNPSDSLTEWKNEYPDYGQIALFGEYLAEYYGASVIADTLNTPLAGISALNYSLSDNGFRDTVVDAYINWMTANILNDTSINPKYGYSRDGLEDLRIFPVWSKHNVDDDINVKLWSDFVDWQGKWYELANINPSPDGNDQLEITFSSNSLASFVVAYVLFNNDGSMHIGHQRLGEGNNVIEIPNVGTNINRVLFMPVKTDRLSGFGPNETAVNLKFSMRREKNTADNLAVRGGQESRMDREEGLSSVSAGINAPSVTPEDFGLKEGDFIRTPGDNDIYIINQFGYKRLVLNPEICLQYGHLGERGCFNAVKIVSSDVRDAFITSNYFTNGETQDGVIYKLNVTGADSAVLEEVNRNNFNRDIHSVFFFNTLEQNSYGE